MKKTKIGKIDYSALNHKPEPHEIETAKYFTKLGLDVLFIKSSNIKGSHNADFQMFGKTWETKSPITYSDSSFEDNIKKAEKQSKYIIFDLRRLNGKNETKYIKELMKRSRSNKIKILLVINKNNELLTFKGNLDKIKT